VSDINYFVVLRRNKEKPYNNKGKPFAVLREKRVIVVSLNKVQRKKRKIMSNCF